MKQPMVPVALLYGTGVVLGHFVEAPLLAAWLVAFGLLLAALIASTLRGLLLPAALLLFGWSNLTSRTTVVSPQDLRLLLGDNPKLIEARGEIVATPSQRIFLQGSVEKSHTLAELKVTAVRLGRGPWQPAHGRIMSRTGGVLARDFFDGQRVEVSGLALPPPPPVAVELFDYGRHLALRGLHYELKIESPQLWKVFGVPVPLPMAERFRVWAQRTLARGLPVEDEPLRLQWAMLLGWQTALTSEVSEPFMRSGTMHIFAISGLHIALIAWIFLALLRAVAVPRLIGGCTVVGLIWFYTAATGWQASAIRSTVMMSVIILGSALKRPPSLLNSLATAACVILVWQPEQLFQAGFQLSFFVVLSLALLAPPIERLRVRLFLLDPLLPYELRPRGQRFLIEISHLVWKGFATSLAAFIGSAPLMAYYFHLFTPGSLLANLVVVPISSLALMSGLGALVTGDLAPFLTELFNHSGWFFMWFMTWLSERAAELPAAWCHVRAPGPLLFLLYYGLLLALCGGWFTFRRARWFFGFAAVLFLAAWIIDWRQERAWHRLTVLPVGGSHIIYLEPARGGEQWLINCGSRSGAGFTLKPFLQARGVNRLEHLVLTHGDSDFFGGVSELRTAFRFEDILVSPVAFRSAAYQSTLTELEKLGRVRRLATNGFAARPWIILHPGPAERFPLAEDNAIVAWGEFEGVRVLLVPQLGKAGQNAFVKRHSDLRADIVIAGLPVKDEPLAAEWLAVLKPRLIVIADSETSLSRRASHALLSRLRRTGAAVLHTGAAGSTTISVREGAWRTATAREVIASEPAREMAAPDARGE